MSLRNNKPTHRKNKGRRPRNQIQELPDATPDALPLYHGLYILEANINRHLYDYDYFPGLFEEKINCYKRREFHRLNLRMKNAVNEIFSGKFDEKYRILSINIQLDNGKTVHCLIDLIPHDYDTNKYMNMNPREMRDFKEILKIKIQNDLEFLTDIENTTDDDLKEALPSVSLKQYIDFMGNQFLTFDEMQTVAINQRKRFIGLGAPNTGKSIVGIEILKNYVIWLDETGDDDGGDIYCIVQSEVLKNTLFDLWNKSDLPAHLKQRVQFVTDKELYEKHYKDAGLTFISTEDVINIISNKKVTHLKLKTNYQINFKQFQNDCNRDKKLPKDLFTKETLTEKIIYEEFRIMFGFTKEQYVGDDKKPDEILGAREAKFGGEGVDGKNKARRAYLWGKKEGLEAFLEKNKLMHIDFASLPNETKIKFCWVDEFLDLSPSLIYSLLLATVLDLFVTGDIHQNIFWARANLKYINRKIRDLSDGKVEFKIIDLPITHLVSNAVKTASNRSLKLKIFLGGLNYKKQYTEINTATTDNEEGSEEWITITEKQKYSSLKIHPSIILLSERIRNNPQNFLVVIPDENFREDAKELFPAGTIILTIAQAKGQHYDTAILFGPLDYPKFQDEFIAANTKLEEKNINSEDDIIITNSLAPRDAETEGGIGNYYTSQTRAWRELIVLQQERHNINKLINYLKPKPRIILNNELVNVAPITIPVVVEEQNPAPVIEVQNVTPVIEVQNAEDTYQNRLNGLKKLIVNRNFNEARDFYDNFMKGPFNLDNSFDEFKEQMYLLDEKKPSKKDSDIAKDKNQRQDQTLPDNTSHHRGRGRNQRGGRNDRNGNRGRGGRNDDRKTQVNQNKSTNDKKKQQTKASAKPEIDQRQNNQVEPSKPKLTSEEQLFYFNHIKDAVWNNKIDLVQEFIKANVNFNTIKIGVTFDDGVSDLLYPLEIAIARGYVELVRIILSLPNIDPNQTEDAWLTPIFRAMAKNNIEIFNLLLAHEKIDINKETNFANEGLICPWKFALKYGLFSVADRLFQDRRLIINDEGLNYIIMNYSSIAVKTIKDMRATIINNFNEETINDLFTHKPFLNMLFYYINSSDKPNTIFNFIISDSKRLNHFIECAMKEHNGKRFLFSLLEKSAEEPGNVIGVTQQSIRECVNRILEKLSVEQVLILYDDLCTTNPLNKEIEARLILQSSYLKTPTIEIYGLAIKMGLSSFLEKKLPFLTMGLLVENTIFNFIKSAIEIGYPEIVSQLLSLPLAGQTLTSKNMHDLLMFSIEKNQGIIFALILTDLNIDRVDEYNFSAVREKIQAMNDKLVREPLIKTIDDKIEECSKRKMERDIVEVAIEKNQEMIVTALIKKEVNFNFLMKNGLTPLQAAIKNENIKLVESLLTSKSIDINICIRGNGKSPTDALSLAIKSKKSGLISLLIKDQRTSISMSALDKLLLAALAENNMVFFDIICSRYKEDSLNALDKANYNEEAMSQLLIYDFSDIVLFYNDDFINSLNKKPEAWKTLTQCLMKKDPKTNEHYILKTMRIAENHSSTNSYLTNAKIILSKMSIDQLFLLLNSSYQAKHPMKKGQQALEELIEKTMTDRNEVMNYVLKVDCVYSVGKDIIKNAMNEDCVSVVQHYLNHEKHILSANDISELLLQAVEKNQLEVCGLILRAVKPDQLSNINFKTAIDKTNNETIRQKLVKAQYFAGLLKQSNSVSVANLLTSKDAILFLFDKDILSENLFNIIMTNPQLSLVFLQCLLAPHGSIKSTKPGSDKVNETYIKMGVPYISRLLGINEKQFTDKAKFKEISQMIEEIYKLKFVFRLLNANCAKQDEKYFIKNIDTVKPIIERVKLHEISNVDKINHAIELGLVNIVAFFIQQGLELSSQEITSFLMQAIAKNNLNLILIILEDDATKQGIHKMEINIASLCSEAKKANVDVAIVKELTKHLQTQQSIFTLPSNPSTNTPQNDPKILQDNTDNTLSK